MPDSSYDDLVVNGRTYLPVLRMDADGRQVEWKVRGVLPGNWRIVQPYLCTDCAAITVDPQLHNEVHDGRSCEVCGCTEDNACTGGCWWIDDRLCSRCTRTATEPSEWLCACGHPNLDHDDGTCTVTNDDPRVEWAECPCRRLTSAASIIPSPRKADQ